MCIASMEQTAHPNLWLQGKVEVTLDALHLGAGQVDKCRVVKCSEIVIEARTTVDCARFVLSWCASSCSPALV